MRLSMEMEEGTLDYFKELARKEGVDLSEIFRRAMAAMKAYHEQMQLGRAHLGFVSDPTKLDAELTGLLTVQ